MHYPFSTGESGHWGLHELLILVFDSKLLAELNGHNQCRHRQPAPPIYKNDYSAYKEKKISPPWLLSQPGHRGESPGDQRNTAHLDSWGHKPHIKKKSLITKYRMEGTFTPLSSLSRMTKSRSGFVNNVPRAIMMAMGHSYHHFVIMLITAFTLLLCRNIGFYFYCGRLRICLLKC